MEFDKIVELIRVIDNSGVAEFQMQDRDFQITMKKNEAEGKKPAVDWQPETPVTYKPEPAPLKLQEEHVIKSHLVGIFHASKEEDSRPYVSVGDQVEEGQIVGTIEAMKLMNEVVSGFTGRVAEILVKDGQLIEYGQPLLIIE